MKVVIADAQNLFRTLLERWIANETDLTVAGATRSGKEALELALGKEAGLVILDPLLHEMSGLKVADRLSEAAPNVRVLAIYHAGEPFLIDRLQRSGFHGGLSKRMMQLPQLLEAVSMLRSGSCYFCSETCRIQNWLDNDQNSFVRLLTGREQQVLALIGAGMSNSDIGRELTLSPATVQTHRRNLFRKLGVHDTPSLMRYAMDQGFWSPEYALVGFKPWSA